MRRLLSKPVRVVILVLSLSLLSSLVEARVTRIEIVLQEVVADEMAFGDTGPYEKLRGTVYFEVDPDDPRNAVVFDLDKAPRNKDSMVEFSADFFILKPTDMTKGNGGLFFEVNNRGDKQSLILYNDTPPGANNNNPSKASDLGNGFLLRQGYTLAWVGWQANVLPGDDKLTAQFPIASEEDGSPISERIITEFVDKRGTASQVFTRSLSDFNAEQGYEAISTDQAVAMAELRVRPSDSPRPPDVAIPEGELIPTSEWSFANCPSGPPGTPSATSICVKAGFRNDLVYDLRYKAINPVVAALGYATTRDFVSFLRNDPLDDVGTPNPVFGLDRALGYANSQSSFYLHDFLYQGFNEDEYGRAVFDGLHIHVGGIYKWPLNYRFASFGRTSTQHSGRFRQDGNFPRTYAIRQDPVSGRIDGILKRPWTDPKVIHTDTSTEYWGLRSSLGHTDEDALVDLVAPSNVRQYLFSSIEHGPVTKGAPPNRGLVDFDGNPMLQQLTNPTHPGVLVRPLYLALDRWVRYGETPPESRVPRIDDGTLMDPDRYCSEFPTIPGVTCNGLYNASGELDLGPRVQGNRGVIDPDYLIPPVLSVHRVLVPNVDAIGNDIAGIRHPFVEAPIATLTGWSLRGTGWTEGDAVQNRGMMIPLFKTKAERLEAGDPRPSLEELYGDHTGYVRAVADAALNLWFQGLMLLEDVFQTIQEADDSDVLR